MSEPELEIETTLLVPGDRADELFGHLAKREHIAGMDVLRRRVLELDDIYLDTQEKALRAIGWGLRLRRQTEAGGGARTRLTLKGPARKGTAPVGATVAREELEHDWSPEALQLFDAKLLELGVAAGGSLEQAPDSEPIDVLAGVGFAAWQTRRARRIAIDLGQPCATPSAELALDAVRFTVHGREIRHFELEVEARSKGCNTARIADDLRAGLPDGAGTALRPWPHSKTSVGAALVTLDRWGELFDYTKPDGTISQSGYARIDELLA